MNKKAVQHRMDKPHVPYELYKCTGLFYGQHISNIIFKLKKAFRILENVVRFLKATI